MQFRRTILTGALAVILPVVVHAQNIVAKDTNNSTSSTSSRPSTLYNYFMPKKDSGDAGKAAQPTAPTQSIPPASTSPTSTSPTSTAPAATPPTAAVTQPPQKLYTPTSPAVRVTSQPQPQLVGYLSPGRQQLLIQKEQKKVAVLQNQLDQRLKMQNYINQHPKADNPKIPTPPGQLPQSHLQGVIQASIQFLQINLQQSQKRLNVLLSGPVSGAYARQMYSKPIFTQKVQPVQKVQP